MLAGRGEGLLSRDFSPGTFVCFGPSEFSTIGGEARYPVLDHAKSGSAGAADFFDIALALAFCVRNGPRVHQVVENKVDRGPRWLFGSRKPFSTACPAQAVVACRKHRQRRANQHI